MYVSSLQVEAMLNSKLKKCIYPEEVPWNWHTRYLVFEEYTSFCKEKVSVVKPTKGPVTCVYPIEKKGRIEKTRNLSTVFGDSIFGRNKALFAVSSI